MMTDDDIRRCLRDFVLAYANAHPTEDRDHNETRLFGVWLRATGLLGMTAIQATPRPGGRGVE